MLGFQHYGRYVDDFYLVDNSLQNLDEAVQLIVDFLSMRLHLSLNQQKTKVYTSTSGIPFLGGVICPNGRFIRSRTNRHLEWKLNDAICMERDLYVRHAVQNAHDGYMKHFSGR